MPFMGKTLCISIHCIVIHLRRTVGAAYILFMGGERKRSKMVCRFALPLDSNLFAEELAPFLVFPATAYLILDKSVPEHCGGNVDAVLS